MTLKFNYVKYCLVILGVAGLLTNINSVNAFWSWPDSSQWCRNGVFPNCSDYPVSSRSTTFSSAGTDYNDLNVMNYQLSYGSNSCYSNCYFTSQGSFYRLTSDSHTISGNLKTFNDGDFLSWRLNDSVGTAFYGYVAFQYSFINYVKDGVNSVFSWWYDLGKKYNSISVSGLPALPDINNTGDFFDFVQPRHGSWIFYNRYYDIDLKTVQYIGNQVLYDKFIYVDSLATTDNIWLVDTELNKAWSMTETDINIISDFLFGNIKFTDEVLNNAGRTDYYDIVLNTGGNSFLPVTYGNFTASSFSSQGMRGIKSFKGSNIGITYNKIYDFKDPNYGSSNSGSGSVSTGSSYDSYVACRDTYTNIKNWANSEYLCRQDMNNGLISSGYFENLFHLIYNFTSNITGGSLEDVVANTTNCQNWVDYSVMAYYSSDLGNENLSNYQEKFSFADRNSWSLNMLDVSDYCTYDVTDSNFTSNYSNSCYNKCWACGRGLFGDDLCSLNCSVDCADISSPGKSLHDRIEEATAKWGISVLEYPYQKFSIPFNSGYTYISEKYNVAGQCLDDNFTKSYNYVDLGVYALLLAIFIFLLVHL